MVKDSGMSTAAHKPHPVGIFDKTVVAVSERLSPRNRWVIQIEYEGGLFSMPNVFTLRKLNPSLKGGLSAYAKPGDVHRMEIRHDVRVNALYVTARIIEILERN